MTKGTRQMMDGMVGLVLMGVLANLITRDDTAEQIAHIGTAFSRTIRIAAGEEPRPVPDQTAPLPVAMRAAETMLRREYGGAGKGTAAFDSESSETYYAQGLTGNMHGRKRGQHRGGPDHDPIWGETE